MEATETDYKHEYIKAVGRCETVLKELIFQKHLNKKAVSQEAHNYEQLANKAPQKCKQLQKNVTNLKTQLSKVKKQNRWLKSKKCFNIKMKAKLQESSVNPGTASMIMRGGSKSKCYEKEDIAAAALLKSVSNKSYKILRKRKLLRLPSEFAIRKWLQD